MTKPVLVLATGPTLKNFDVGLFRGLVHVIAVNDAYRVCPWADEFYACDFDWWVFHGMNVAALPGRKITCRHDPSTPVNAIADEVRGIMKPRRGISMNPGEVFVGHNSGFQALQLAMQRSPRVFLAGFDMGATGSTHFFGDHPPAINVGSNYGWFVGDFEETIGDIRRNARVSLVTRPSALGHLFETVSVDEALHELSTS